MASPYVVLGGILYRIIGPPWLLQRSTGAGGGWELVSGSGGEPLVLGDSDPPDFLVTEDGDILMVEDNRG